jgi:hypothetical protein
MTDAAVADLGHNEPPDDIEILRSNLAETNGDLTDRRDELMASVERMPATVEDDEMAGKFADQIKLFTACTKAAEDRRKTTKEPFLASGKLVDAFFKGIGDPLGKAKKDIEGRLHTFNVAKAAEEKRRRDEEERQAREEAAQREREMAERAEADQATEADLDEAVAAEDRAQQATEDASANAADMSRTRGEYGAVSSLRTTWAGEITDARTLDLDALRPHLSLDAMQKAVNAYVRTGARELRGARIYEKQSTVVS